MVLYFQISHKCINIRSLNTNLLQQLKTQRYSNISTCYERWKNDRWILTKENNIEETGISSFERKLDLIDGRNRKTNGRN